LHFGDQTRSRIFMITSYRLEAGGTCLGIRQFLGSQGVAMGRKVSLKKARPARSSCFAV
jgi:hypothetical protein